VIQRVNQLPQARDLGGVMGAQETGEPGSILWGAATDIHDFLLSHSRYAVVR
jgi:hypothetical protein